MPLLPYLCPQGDRCKGYQRAMALYYDDNHFSLSTARRISKDLLLPLLKPGLEAGTRQAAP